MLTVSNLAQRQKQATNNIDERFKQMRRVPVGGYGALIQKPNQKAVKQNITPTLFNPTPMSSSLPYLAEHSKFRSNINQLLMQEHIRIQRDNLKASLDFDSVKIGEQLNKEIDNKVIKDVYSPNTRELLNRYLTGEMKTRQEEGFNAARARRDNLFRELNPGLAPDAVQPRDEPPRIAVDRIPDVTLGDLGRAEEARRRELLRAGFDRLRQPVNLNIVRELRQQRETELREQLDKIENNELRTAGGVSGRSSYELVSKVINKIKERKGTGFLTIDPELSQKKYLTNEARLNGDDGGGLAHALRGNL